MGCGSSSVENKDLINERIILGYWAAHIQGQPARYILELAGVSYEDKLYTPDTASEWFGNDKQNLGLDYPNLPYLIHGDFKITESQNIANYLIEITNQKSLLGEGLDQYKVGNIRYVCQELIGKVYSTQSKKGEELKTAIEKDITPKAKQLQQVLGNKTQFFKELTIADIYAYVFASNLKKNLPDAYKDFKNSFDPLIEKFESIPAIKKYQESERFAKVNH